LLLLLLPLSGSLNQPSPLLLEPAFKSLDPLPLLALLLLFLLSRLLLLANTLTLQLIRPALSNVARAQVAKQLLEYPLNDVARDKIDDHDRGHDGLKVFIERHQLHGFVQLGQHLSRAGERDGRDSHNAVEHALVLRKGLAEGPALVVDGEGGNLLDELEEVDCAVEEGGLKLGFKVNYFGATGGG